jgi:hypothetical protein
MALLALGDPIPGPGPQHDQAIAATNHAMAFCFVLGLGCAVAIMTSLVKLRGPKALWLLATGFAFCGLSGALIQLADNTRLGSSVAQPGRTDGVLVVPLTGAAILFAALLLYSLTRLRQ